MDQNICSAPWCNRLTAKVGGQDSRHIGEIEVCRPCYQYVWEQARKLGKKMTEIFPDHFNPPMKLIPKAKTTCPRIGCSKVLPVNATPNIRRRIGNLIVCRACYEAAWELAQRKSITLQEAWTLLPEKDWQQKQRERANTPVACNMPWCQRKTVPQRSKAIGPANYVCGQCRGYLKRIARRFRHLNKAWQQWAHEAVKGKIPKPCSPEPCAMPWCHRVERPFRYGPKGEPLCNSDGVYLYLYAKRHSITVHEAFYQTPPPRLVHTRY